MSGFFQVIYYFFIQVRKISSVGIKKSHNLKSYYIIKRTFHFINIRTYFWKIKSENKIRVSFFCGIIVNICSCKDFLKLPFPGNIVITFQHRKPEGFSKPPGTDEEEKRGRHFYTSDKFRLINIIVFFFLYKFEVSPSIRDPFEFTQVKSSFREDFINNRFLISP